MSSILLSMPETSMLPDQLIIFEPKAISRISRKRGDEPSVKIVPAQGGPCGVRQNCFVELFRNASKEKCFARWRRRHGLQTRDKSTVLDCQTLLPDTPARRHVLDRHICLEAQE